MNNMLKMIHNSNVINKMTFKTPHLSVEFCYGGEIKFKIIDKQLFIMLT